MFLIGLSGEKILKILITLLFNADSDNVNFVNDDMGTVNVDLSNVSLDNHSFNDDDSETIIHVKHMA